MFETTHFHVRDARDRLIDLLGMGKTYPLRDLAVRYEPLVVPFDTSASVLIEPSQKGVLYQLHDKHKKEVKVKALGDGTRILLETPEIRDDVTYKIHASKKQSGKENYLHQTANVKVGPDVKLVASIPEAPVNYGASVEVEIEGSQEGVVYRLVYLSKAGPGQDSSEEKVELPGAFKSITDAKFSNQLDKKEVPSDLRKELDLSLSDPVTVSVEATNSVWLIIGGKGNTYMIRRTENQLDIYSVAVMRGNKNTIKIPSQPVFEDTGIRIRATKTFDLSENRDDRTALLDVKLPLKVRPSPDLEVSVDPSPIIGYKQPATIKIAGTQKSAKYKLWVRAIPDDDFVHRTVPRVEVLKVSVPGKPNVRVRKPERPEVWQAPKGYSPLGDFQTGNGGELQFKLNSLTDDSLVTVQALKENQTDRKYAVQLEQAAVILVRPNPAPPLSLQKLSEPSSTSREIRVSGGQPGVFYHFRLDPDPAGEDLGLPVYFHKTDYSEEGLKGLNQLKVGVDFVVASDLPLKNRYKSPVVDLGVQPGKTLRVRAVNAQTGVEADLNQPVGVEPPAPGPTGRAGPETQ